MAVYTWSGSERVWLRQTQLISGLLAVWGFPTDLGQFVAHETMSIFWLALGHIGGCRNDILFEENAMIFFVHYIEDGFILSGEERAKKEKTDLMETSKHQQWSGRQAASKERFPHRPRNRNVLCYLTPLSCKNFVDKTAWSKKILNVENVILGLHFLEKR